MKNSFDRAIALLGTSAEYANYESIKIMPVNDRCCCFHCWPRTWDAINEYISPFGSLKDEGDVLIGNKDEKFVLECHESGPEIVYYLGLGADLIKSIVELVVTVLKALEKDKGKNHGNVRILRRKWIKGEIDEEQIMEITLPLPGDTIKKLKDNLRESIRKNK